MMDVSVGMFGGQRTAFQSQLPPSTGSPDLNGKGSYLLSHLIGP